MYRKSSSSYVISNFHQHYLVLEAKNTHGRILLRPACLNLIDCCFSPDIIKMIQQALHYHKYIDYVEHLYLSNN